MNEADMALDGVVPHMCEERDSRLPLRQGDIFVATEGSEPRGVGIVVTSDCDIARNKAWRRLTWVPLVPIASYAASRWAYEEVERLVGSAQSDLTTAVRKSREARGLPPLSDAALDHWINEVVADRLLVPFAFGDDHDAKQRMNEKFAAVAAALALARDVIRESPPRHEAWPPDVIARTFAAVHALKRSKQATYRPESLASAVQQALSQHPGDVFVMYRIPGLVVEECVALLRFLRELDHDEIGLQAGDALERGLPFYRVAALLSPYRYDLTRRLGAVFSDIGLPQNYEDHKRNSAKRIAEGLVRES